MFMRGLSKCHLPLVFFFFAGPRVVTVPLQDYIFTKSLPITIWSHVLTQSILRLCVWSTWGTFIILNKIEVFILHLHLTSLLFLFFTHFLFCSFFFFFFFLSLFFGKKGASLQARQPKMNERFGST